MQNSLTRSRRAFAALGLTALLGLAAATAPTASAVAPPTVAPPTVAPPPITPQIVGGQIAPDGAWPSMTVLLRQYEPQGPFQLLCGATLVATRWVLTAAHCVDDLTAGQIKAAVGFTWLPDITKADRLTVDRVVIHPKYRTSQSNDVALLRLAKPHAGPFAKLVGPDQDGQWGPGTLATVTGWGLKREDGFMSQALRQVDVPIVTDPVCAKANPGTNTRIIVCAGWPQGGRDSCTGDSGGPLWAPIGRTWYQLGIVSFGRGCAQAGFPGAYSEIRAQLRFITATMRSGT